MCRIIHLFCVLRYLLDSLIINSALHTDRVIWLDKFAALIFSDYESFFCFFLIQINRSNQSDPCICQQMHSKLKKPTSWTLLQVNQRSEISSLPP